MEANSIWIVLQSHLRSSIWATFWVSVDQFWVLTVMEYIYISEWSVDVGGVFGVFDTINYVWRLTYIRWLTFASHLDEPSTYCKIFHLIFVDSVQTKIWRKCESGSAAQQSHIKWKLWRQTNEKLAPPLIWQFSARLPIFRQYLAFLQNIFTLQLHELLENK